MSRAEGKTPIQELSDEHVVIMDGLEMVRAAMSVVEQTKRQTPARTWETLQQAVASLAREFDKHLLKEEEALFPAVEAHLGAEGGPTEVMRMEHEDLREGMWELRRLVGESEAPEGVYEQLGETTEALGNLLVEHTHTEHHIFFPMAEALLTDAERTEMAQKFRRIEEEQEGRRSG